MKVCINCRKTFNTASWSCPNCHGSPITSEGFLSFAPESAAVNKGFVPGYFEQLAKLEQNNFWFVARNRLIIWSLLRYFPNVNNFLEIGCGTGFVMSGIRERFPRLTLSGSEIYSTALKYASKRVHNAELFQMDAQWIPFENEFDVIGAFDVLEHIDDDESVLRQMYKASRNNGGILLSVPQHDFLWSQYDEKACHVRRYNNRELMRKVVQAGFEIARVTSFVTLLFPFMIISRLNKKKISDEFDVMNELKIGKGLNFLFKKTLDLERCLIQYGMNFPFGGSLFIIARKI